MGVPVSIGGAYFHIFGKRAKPEQAVPRLRSYGVTVPEDYQSQKRADNIDSDEVNRAKERFDAETQAKLDADRMRAAVPNEHYGRIREKFETVFTEESAGRPSATPPFVLANYLITCLIAYDAAMAAREAARDLFPNGGPAT